MFIAGRHPQCIHQQVLGSSRVFTWINWTEYVLMDYVKDAHSVCCFLVIKLVRCEEMKMKVFQSSRKLRSSTEQSSSPSISSYPWNIRDSSRTCLAADFSQIVKVSDLNYFFMKILANTQEYTKFSFHLNSLRKVQHFRTDQGAPRVQTAYCKASVGYVDLNVRNTGVITDLFINGFKCESLLLHYSDLLPSSEISHKLGEVILFPFSLPDLSVQTDGRAQNVQYDRANDR